MYVYGIETTPSKNVWALIKTSTTHLAKSKNQIIVWAKTPTPPPSTNYTNWWPPKYKDIYFNISFQHIQMLQTVQRL